MQKSNTTIVIIDDNITHETPPYDDLKNKFKKIISFKKIKNGLIYLNNNLQEKKIVILDYQFPEDKDGGLKILKEIRKKSFLTPVILLTDGKISKDKYPKLINNKLDIYAKKGEGDDIEEKIFEAEKKLNNNVAVALEEWISVQEKEKREQPYTISASGEEYSLNEILTEVRKETDFGQNFIKDLNALTIHLLLKNKVKL